jgi:hypothetical protein
MDFQQLPHVSAVQIAQKKNIENSQCVHVNFENYRVTYGLTGIDEHAARFIEGVFLSIKPLEDGLYIVNDCENQNGKITFERYAEEGALAVFSCGYEFELNADTQPIAARHGEIRWVFWGA